MGLHCCKRLCVYGFVALSDLEGEEVDDVPDAFGHDLRPGRVLHRRVEEPQELPQRRLVHDVHQRHLHNQEVQDTAPGGHWPVLLTGLVYLQLRLSGDRQLLTHLREEQVGLRFTVQSLVSKAYLYCLFSLLHWSV